MAANTLERPELVRALGVTAAIAMNVANMIGTGVFLKSRVMTCNVGSASAVLAVWVAAGLLSLAGTFSYAEVAALMPEAGGEYVFIRRAYGRLLGFLYGWTFFSVVRTGSQAALAVGFAIFMNVAIGGGLERDLFNVSLLGLPLHLNGLTLVALALIWGVGLYNTRPVAAGGNAAIVLTVLKMLLLVAIAAGAFLLAKGSFGHLAESAVNGRCEQVEASARGGIAGFGAAMLGALWAYDGWNNVTPLAGEVKDPARNLPRAFLGGMAIVGALYLLCNIAYYYVLTPTEIANVSVNSTVATEVMQRFAGPGAVTFVAIALMFSSFGAIHASVLANSRIPYAMAREGLFFRGLSELSPRTRVPVRATIAQAAWASVLALSGSYDTLTDSVIFAAWLFYGLAAGSVFVFRRTMPDAPRAYRAFGYPVLPAVFLLVTAWLIENTFVARPLLALVGVAIMLAGLPFYWWFTRSLTPPSPRAGPEGAAGR